MDNLQTAPEELIWTLDPTPEAPDPIRIPTETLRPCLRALDAAPELQGGPEALSIIRRYIMDNLQTAPEELIQTLDPAPEAPDPIQIPRETWLQLIHAGHAETPTHVWIWAAEGVYRIAKVWIGHPAIADHWQLIISFGGETVGN